MPPFRQDPSSNQESERDKLLKQALKRIESEGAQESQIEDIVIATLKEAKTEETHGYNIFIALKNSIIGGIKDILKHKSEKPKEAVLGEHKKEEAQKDLWWKKDDDKPELRRNEDGSWETIKKD